MNSQSCRRGKGNGRLIYRPSTATTADRADTFLKSINASNPIGAVPELIVTNLMHDGSKCTLRFSENGGYQTGP